MVVAWITLIVGLVFWFIGKPGKVRAGLGGLLTALGLSFLLPLFSVAVRAFLASAGQSFSKWFNAISVGGVNFTPIQLLWLVAGVVALVLTRRVKGKWITVALVLAGVFIIWTICAATLPNFQPGTFTLISELSKEFGTMVKLSFSKF